MTASVPVPDKFRHAYFVQAKISPSEFNYDCNQNVIKIKKFNFAIETFIGEDDLSTIWRGKVKLPTRIFLTPDEIMNLNFEDLNVEIGMSIATAPKDRNVKLDIAFGVKRDYFFSKNAMLKQDMYFGKDADFTHNFLNSFTKWNSRLWYSMPNITLAKSFMINETELAMGCEYQGMGMGFGTMRHEDGSDETLILGDDFQPHVIPLSVVGANHYAYSLNDEDGSLIPLLKEDEP